MARKSGIVMNQVHPLADLVLGKFLGLECGSELNHFSHLLYPRKQTCTKNTLLCYIFNPIDQKVGSCLTFYKHTIFKFVKKKVCLECQDRP